MFEPWLTRWSLISEGDPVFTASSRSSRLLKWIIAYTGLSAAWLIEDGASPARGLAIGALAEAALAA
jgi:streptomycin 6-kinase